MSSREIHAEPQISPHEISLPFSSSGGAIIHRLRTNHIIRAELSDKIERVVCAWLAIMLTIGPVPPSQS